VVGGVWWVGGRSWWWCLKDEQVQLSREGEGGLEGGGGEQVYLSRDISVYVCVCVWVGGGGGGYIVGVLCGG
jgi:hypothetical protein